MRQLGQVDVALRDGTATGPNASAKTCSLSVTSAEWQQRRFIVFATDIQDQSVFLGFTDVFEVTSGGPTPFLSGDANVASLCQGGAVSSEPPGWAAMPKPLRSFLCSGRRAARPHR
jgi:hypothetical protein